MAADAATPPTQIVATKPGSGFEFLFQVFDGLRSDVECRRRRQLAKISNAEKILTKLLVSADRSMIDVVVTVGRKKSRLRKPVSDLAMVERAVATFGQEIFRLSDLVCRVAEVFPDQKLARESISRRLHDLKRKGIVIVAHSDSLGNKPQSRSYFAYRRTLAPAQRDSRPAEP